MNQRETLAAIKAIRGMTATVRDGEFRVTMTLDAIAGRYVGTRKQAIARAERMASYTNDSEDAIGTARAMSAKFFGTAGEEAGRENGAAAREADAIAALAESKVVGTIDLTPTWAGIVRVFIMALEHGNETGKAAARAEIARMATLADERNEMAQMLADIRAELDSCESDIRGFASTSGMAGWPAINRRDDSRKLIAARMAGDTPAPAPAPGPFHDPNAVQVYRLKGDGCQAPGAIVLRHLPDNDCTPYVVHFRNDQDSERTGKPCYYFGDYCRTLADGWRAFADKVARYDPTGELAA